MVSPRGCGRTRLSADARRILAVQALRAFVYGLGSVILGVTLARRGLSGIEVGVVLAALLTGTALVTFAIARFADRVGRRRWYLGLIAVMGVAGTVYAVTDVVPVLVLAALTGTVSTEVVESGPIASLEQAMLPQVSDRRSVTRLFGTYSTVATLAGSLGALAAGASTVLDVAPERLMLAYPVAAAIALPLAGGLSTAVEVPRTTTRQGRGPLSRSRGVVRRLAALFSLDSFGGGFVTQAFIAYWFAERFGTSPEVIGAVFFAVGILQAVSFQAAVRLAGKVGLLRTMVFTHLPSNALLACVPLAPTQTGAIALLLARFALSQMDVPTRQAYVVGIVDPDERTAAAAVTNASRTIVRPIAPLLAGPILQVWVGAPFVIAGALKALYDVGLYASFRDRRRGASS